MEALFLLNDMPFISFLGNTPWWSNSMGTVSSLWLENSFHLPNLQPVS
jgi:hypothetical protein